MRGLINVQYAVKDGVLPVLNRRRVGAYHLLEVAAGRIAGQARPGQFVAVSVGGPASALPRATTSASDLRMKQVVDLIAL